MQTLFSSPDNGPNAATQAYYEYGPECQTRCDSCGVRAPTKYAAFHQHIGAVVLMFHQRYRGNLCRECINTIFRRTTLTTLGLGWWGMISVIVTPFVLIHNVVRYLMVRDSNAAPAPYAALPDRER
ncbi:MAG: hypothetical protein ACREDR_32705 [Blastocatellia bacterium]